MFVVIWRDPLGRILRDLASLCVTLCDFCEVHSCALVLCLCFTLNTTVVSFTTYVHFVRRCTLCSGGDYFGTVNHKELVDRLTGIHHLERQESLGSPE